MPQQASNKCYYVNMLLDNPANVLYIKTLVTREEGNSVSDIITTTHSHTSLWGVSTTEGRLAGKLCTQFVHELFEGRAVGAVLAKEHTLPCPRGDDQRLVVNLALTGHVLRLGEEWRDEWVGGDMTGCVSNG